MTQYQVQTDEIYGTRDVGQYDREMWINNTKEAGEKLLVNLKKCKTDWQSGSSQHRSLGQQVVGSFFGDFFDALIARLEAVLEKWTADAAEDTPVDKAVKEIIELLKPLDLSRGEMMQVQTQVENSY